MDNPFKKNNEWYFYDETQANEYGPYATKEEAQDALDEYCRLFLT